MSNKINTMLNQSRKLQERLEALHDDFNARWGSSNKNTMELMSLFCLSYAMVCDLESMLDHDE